MQERKPPCVRGDITIVICLPSRRGSRSTLATASKSRFTRINRSTPKCWCAISRPLKRKASDADLETYGSAVALILNPALSAFNAGVRGYYFALACTAWLAGPAAFMTATLGALGLLVWRQSHASGAKGVAQIHQILAKD